METVYVGRLAADMGMKILNPNGDFSDRVIKGEDINRPALQLTGFFEHFVRENIQIIGLIEKTYLDTLTQERRLEIFDRLFSCGIPCLIFTRGYVPPDYVLELAKKHDIPILLAESGTTATIARLLRYIQEKNAPELTIHGELVDVFGEGVLITGESGIGKSEAALELIKRGHRLVADDAVLLRRINENILMGTAPEVTKYFIEIRGIGVIDIKALFGAQSVKEYQEVGLVVNLEEWDREKAYDRLGEDDNFREYLGNKVTCYTVPVRPGRNIAVVVEMAAINFRQKKMGYSATDELYRRLKLKMARDREG